MLALQKSSQGKSCFFAGTLQYSNQLSSLAPVSDDVSGSESESENDNSGPPLEQDDDRRRTLLEANHAGDSDPNQLKGQIKLEDYTDYFHLPKRSPKASRRATNVNVEDVITIEDDEKDFGCDLHPASAVTGATSAVTSSHSQFKPESKTRGV